jgi:hypothetical protein
MWFITTATERQNRWGARKRAHFEEFAATVEPPAGLLAY